MGCLIFSVKHPSLLHNSVQHSLSCRLNKGGVSCQPQEERQASLQLWALKRFDDSEENQDSRLAWFSIPGPRGSVL